MINNEMLEKSLQRIHEWIRSADQKVSIFLTFEGVLFGFLFSPIKQFIGSNIKNLSEIFIIFLIISIVCFADSLIKLCSSLVSRTKNSGKKSISFFGDIASLDKEKFIKEIKKCDSSRIADDLIEQIHISSKIADKKHNLFQESLGLLFVSLISLVLAFVWFYLWGAYAK